VLAGAAFAAHEAAVLDGASYKIEANPDEAAEDRGEKAFDDVLTFAEGRVSMSEAQKIGFLPSPYVVSKAGESDWTFKAEQQSRAEGTAIWTGTIRDGDIDGKVVRTKPDGTILTYTFRGHKLD
jgi:hypothetical protein